MNTKELQLRELKDMIAQLHTTIKEQNQMIASLQEKLLEKDAREANLLEQIEYLTKKLFGTSSEKKKKETKPLCASPIEEAEEDTTTITVEAETIVVKKHTRKPKTTNEEKLKGIPVEERILSTLSQEEECCPECGTKLVPIGTEYSHQELVYIPAKVKIIRYYTKTYGCPVCKEEAEVPYMIKTKAPASLMKHSLASASSVAWAMYQKYVNAIPLYRQEKDWEQYGIKLSRTTLGNWLISCSETYFTPLYNYFHKELLKRKFLMADETRIQVLKEEGRNAETNSYMWLYRSGEDGLPVILLYEYTQTRARANAIAFLEGFTGYLETDGYQGYQDLPNVKRCCCWAHVRRYFLDAIPKGQEKDYSLPAVQGVQFCDKLFYYERKAKEGHYSFEKRKEYRLRKERPVLEAFWLWVEKQKPMKNSRMEKAIQYVQNRRPYLETYLEDGRCSISNNLSENAIRPFTVGRKNWLFSDTPRGAIASATIYTMVEMAKAHNLNIYPYLKYVLEHRPNKSWSEKELARLAPWNQDVIDDCKNK